LVPQPETGKIGCVRRPCYGRLSPRQPPDNARRHHKFPLGAWWRNYAKIAYLNALCLNPSWGFDVSSALQTIAELPKFQRMSRWIFLTVHQ
jgi:hypothetical protein